MSQTAKYAEEFAVEFFSADRFIFRASDVFTLDDHSHRKSLDRLDNCHVYFLAKRPRLSLVPHSVNIATDTVSFSAEWHIKGVRKQETLSIPRDSFDEAEHSFAVSPYPHRELVSYDARGRAIVATLFASAQCSSD